jgi:NADPH-dependent 2,4-dienoyl-CoA reductase/sulfur reductase-like enzyme
MVLKRSCGALKKKVVIIGGNAAGMSAASQVKRQKPDWEALVFEQGQYISYAGCGMPYYLAGTVPDFEDLIEITPQAAVDKRKIDLRLNCQVVEIKPEEKEVRVKTPQGYRSEHFDFLVLATGSLPQAGGIKYQKSEKIFTLKSLEDTLKIDDFIKRYEPKKCAVIGGGYIAVEMVEAFKTRGLETYLIHRRNDLARTFEKEISDIIKKEMVQEGIILHLNAPVLKVEERNGKAVVSTEKGELSFDFVLLASGVRPNTDMLKGTGLKLGLKGAIKVNRYLQTNYEYIYAAGDCTETVNLITGKPAYVPLALKANKEGFICGLNISGGREEFVGVLGTAITKIFQLGVARTGLSLEEASAHGFHPLKYDLFSRNKAKYYPGMAMMNSLVVIDKTDGRLLGAQLAGPLESVKRIDVYATMIYNKMTIRDAFNLDLSYAPPFSPVYDPVLLAARIGRKYV